MRCTSDLCFPNIETLFERLRYGLIFILNVPDGIWSQISLGDQANHYLATTKNELGVVVAISEAGNTMYPVSWNEFEDPITGVSEARKVAKPF